MTARTHSGRRPGDSGTREAIARAARRQFAELGYDRTSMRQVALEARVDPALVSHFHGSKRQLFLAVIGLPFQPAEVLPGLLAGDPMEAGARLARFALGVFESDEGRSRAVGLIRAATSEPEAARVVRDLLTREVLAPLAEGIGSDDADFRAALLMSQIVGLIMARYIVEVEPLASRDQAAVADAIAPTLQRYLTGDLSATLP
ncbi:TetR family transcriptional regulator [soil metagenome]